MFGKRTARVSYRIFLVSCAVLIAGLTESTRADPLWIFGGYVSVAAQSNPFNIHQSASSGDVFNSTTIFPLTLSFDMLDAFGGAEATARASVDQSGVHAFSYAVAAKEEDLFAMASQGVAQSAIYDSIKLSSRTIPVGTLVPMQIKMILNYHMDPPPAANVFSCLGLTGIAYIDFWLKGSFGEMRVGANTCQGSMGENTRVVNLPLGAIEPIWMVLTTEATAVVRDDGPFCCGKMLNVVTVDADHTGQLALIPLEDFTIESASGHAYADPDTVSYQFSGFARPIDNLPVLNKVKAGAAVPVKFSLGGYRGIDVLATRGPLSGSVTCPNGSGISDVEETVKAGGSSLSYDPTTDLYNYVWKTETSWAGTCRRLTVTLADRQAFSADFDFRK